MLAAILVTSIRLDGAGVPWLLSGSAGRALLGFGRRPRDVDIEVPETEIARAGHALGVTPRFEDGDRRAGWRAAACIRGVEVDLFAGLTVVRSDGRPPLRPDFALQEKFAAERVIAGRRVRISPVEEQVAAAVVTADWARLTRIADGAPEGFSLRPAYLERRLGAKERAAS
jgi:hypothetical protein